MKTFSPGFSDSIASVVDDPRPCPHCDSSSHIAGGLCVGCLLEAGLARADEDQSETLTELLADLHLPDQNWRLGNYEILEEIGRGGMGVIYRARQRHSRRIVAVKRVLSYHSDSRETLARFRREAQAAASLDHPNILPIYEVSESEDGLPFFSMKFAPGGSLQEVSPALRNDPRQCVALVAKIARAVQYAHSKGILHRDLKPGNILLDGRGEPLVSDFGLAKWLDASSDLTRTLTIFGTPGYIAPEQASHSAADLRPTADVYSLGAILFDLLTGRPPFLGAHALSVIRQAAESPAPKLRTLSKVADRDLETICSRCLERESSARYRSAHDLAEDLERWLEGRPIIARPVLPSTKLWRWSKRNPLLTVTLTGCLALGVIAVVWQARNRTLENVAREQAIASHSIAMTAILNLDDATDESPLSLSISRQFEQSLNRIGPARVIVVSPKVQASDPKVVAAQHHAAFLLCGTVRTLGDGRRRVSLRFVEPGGGLLMRQVIDSDSVDTIINALNQAVSDLYSFFSIENRERALNSQLDRGLQNEKASDLILAGRELMQRQSVGDLDHAIGCFERAIQTEPESALARAYFATTAGTRLHYAFEPSLLERATAEATHAIELNRSLPEAHRALAGLAYHDGDVRRALSESYETIELGGPNVPMFAMIGNCLKNLGEPHRALAWYERMAEQSRRPAESAWMIGDCWADMADDERAQANYRRVSELNPELPQGWLGICRLRLLQGDISGARSIFAQHAVQFADHSYTRQMAAQIEFFGRNSNEAEKLYRELVAHDFDGGKSFYGATGYASALASLLLSRGDSTGHHVLQKVFQKELDALRHSPNHPEILYRLAAAESSVGDSESAVSYLQNALLAGWIDYRSLALDPRFDHLRSSEQYKNIVRAMRDRVASLRSLAHKYSKENSDNQEHHYATTDTATTNQIMERTQ